MDLGKKTLKILITVKTYPIPSKKYDELVCTAGVTEEGDFIRLYPINFRDLNFEKQYKKYQWIKVDVVKHDKDKRKESYRPDCDTLELIGEPILTKNGDWSERAKYVLRKNASSLEELKDCQQRDNTSLGIFKPKEIQDLIITADNSEWKESFKAELKQARIFETRNKTLVPPRKVPFKFQYKFICKNPCCKSHKMMIEDWEVGALFWREVDKGKSLDNAALSVRHKFLDILCGKDKETYFYVGTVMAHPKSWVVIGLFYPKRDGSVTGGNITLPLFE